uniref:GIY-YIG endonuclease n=2 Tax=Fusarium fujikuroi species complex TaxID=171627 RepID=A0A6M4B1K1_9HYPO|nr:GIY-YIG endonuclease [Fusarium brevicatenulatum]QJQ35361.1 GIY-YIG endonuclease [Fusarium pseudoanthophilum]
MYSSITKVGGAPKGTPNPEEFIHYFNNVQESKKDIYKLLRKKAGIYVFINNKTNKLYVGSSVNLTRRMAIYYYYYNSDKPAGAASPRPVIIRAMKKYGLDNFSLGIKEFCDNNPKVCLDLEQKWIDHYKPVYNVLTVAGSSSGFKHSIETINKLKEKLSKQNHPKFGSTTSFAPDETKESIIEGIKLFYATNSHPSKGLKGKLSPQYGIGGKFVFCYNELEEELVFPSINAAKNHFKVRWSLIKNNLDTNEWVTINNNKWILQSLPRQKA